MDKNMINLPTNAEVREYEVTLEESGPIADFQKFRTEIVSEMLDDPYENGIYKTSRLYAKLDDYVRQALLSVYNSGRENQSVTDIEMVKEYLSQECRFRPDDSSCACYFHQLLSDMRKTLEALSAPSSEDNA